MTRRDEILVKPTPDEHFVCYGEIAETRLESLDSECYETPTDRFYVRNHSPTPCVDPETWSLTIEGPGVGRPLTLSYEALLKRPARTVTRFLECAGNGRGFFELVLGQPTEGAGWKFGGFGIATWTGVSVRELLDEAEVKPTAVDVLACGLDEARMERPIPLSIAQQDDTLVVYAMNGAPLLPDHGFPARLCVSGWIGGAWVKWLSALTVSEHPQFVHWNTADYVLMGPDHAPQPPALGPVLTTTLLKCALALPWPATLPTAPQTLWGFAWSPCAEIAMVEVSVDGGQSFQRATLEGPNIAAAGVRWQITLQLPPGDHQVIARTTDALGNTQYPPEAQRWNEKGYLFGAYVPHPVRVVSP